MQRKVPEGIVIACDFCGDDWDEVKPMIEGHQGSVLCLECLKQALPGQTASSERFTCTMCLRELPAGKKNWRHPGPSAGANASALVCSECIAQAAGAFDKDPDVDWKRPRRA